MFVDLQYMKYVCNSACVTVPGKRANVAHFFKIELLLP